MFDGIKILDLSVSADALLQHDRLLFPLPVDEQTGAVLDRPRRANDRGLTFTLTPTKAGDKLRCELQGSIHRYDRGGLHNADDFTAADLVTALDDLVTTYTINPFISRLNNIEFGVNVVLPFPVSVVLDNLISYKYRPFTKEPGDGFAYYQCYTQRYVVKLYNKGDQYDLPTNVLRVEVKVLKMAYLTRRGIRLDWLADLLNVANYGPLGTLLVETFTEILFDEPTINPAKLTDRERDVYQKGSNPRFWSIPDDLTGNEYERSRKALQRAEKAFRALIYKYRRGNDWQGLTAALIGQTWERLATVNNDLLTRINERRAAWHDSIKTGLQSTENPYRTPIDTFTKCPKLTGVIELNAGRETVPVIVEKCPKLTGSKKGEMSQINPLSIELIRDNDNYPNTEPNAGRETLQPIHNSSDTTVRKGRVSKLRTNRPTATQLRANPDLFAEF